MRPTRVLSTLLIVLLTVTFMGCGAGKKHPADVVAPVITSAHKGYDIANKTLLSLYDACKAAGEACPAPLKPIITNWNQIDDLADKIDTQFTAVENAWLTLSGLDSPETKAEFQAQLDLLNKLFDELAALIPAVNVSQFVPPNLRQHVGGGK